MKKQKKYALISVYDKTNIIDCALLIRSLGYEIISTGGTAKMLRNNSIQVIPVEEITGNPESFNGRMKTISFQIESGILFDRSKKSHLLDAKRFRIPSIEIVVCNLYPFEETVNNTSSTLKDIIESIDVGGPTMIRAAAKNYNSVLVLVDPGDYVRVLEFLKQKKITQKIRQSLAAKAFGHIAFYDAQIASYFSKEPFPEKITIPLRLQQTLRYGDNPDQKACLYQIPSKKSPYKDLQNIAGRKLSATNVTDIDAGIQSTILFQEPCAVVIKHNNPCGIALGKNISEALTYALEADSESAFGGVIVLNKPLTYEAAKEVEKFKLSGKGQMDIIAAPSIELKAIQLLQTIRKSTGLYTYKTIAKEQIQMIQKNLIGGAIIQTMNNPESSFSFWETVSQKKPTERQIQQMQIAWKFISRIRSNTVAVIDAVLPMTRGIGSGQTSRILATKIALDRAGTYCTDGVLASDSFFPFDDSIKAAAKAKITAIVEQGGSIRDKDSIDASNALGIVLVFTHQRLFWH